MKELHTHRARAHSAHAHLALAVLMLGVALAAPPARAGEAAPPEIDNAYRISPEDILLISVWREEGMEREVIVRPDGGISFPLAGNVQVSGKTPTEVEEEIAARLKRYIPDAVVTVSVKQLSGLRVYVTGQVRNPGQFSVGRYVDVLQAITLAGGLTPFANADDIKILRREGGKEVVYRFNYGQVRKGQNLSQNIQLKADDVVVVP
jgi:polysaccharide export outer membrane protein